MKTACPILIVCIVSCSSCVPLVNSNDLLDDPRLQVTPALRQACEGDSTDVQIGQRLVLSEVDRLTGMTWAEQTAGVAFLCLGDDPCALCVRAIINQIYGL